MYEVDDVKTHPSNCVCALCHSENLNGWRKSDTVSMPNPCSHITRIGVIRAKLHGDNSILEHLDTCPEVNA